MAHVQISQGEDSRTLRIVVDGIDLSNHIYKDGFGIVQVGDDENAVWGVSLILAPDVLDVDLPDTVVLTTVEDRGESA